MYTHCERAERVDWVRLAEKQAEERRAARFVERLASRAPGDIAATASVTSSTSGAAGLRDFCVCDGPRDFCVCGAAGLWEPDAENKAPTQSLATGNALASGYVAGRQWVEGLGSTPVWPSPAPEIRLPAP